ncbi:MAG TPA: adenine deaminase [Bacteroidetes bacterium]|nr:adenine deaminase [Bacteroidota bacterium]
MPRAVPLEGLIRAGRGLEPADLVLKNGRVLNVYSGEIYETDVAIAYEHVVGLGPGYKGKKEIDVNGLTLLPGFLDGHLHIESSMVEVPQFARAVVPLGTTSVVADPHEIANVMGYEGIRYMMEASKYNPLNVFFMLSSCVPSSNLESAGSELRAFDIFPFLQERWVLGLAEVMNFPGVLELQGDLLDKIKIAGEKRIDGHAPGLTGKDLNAYIAAGIGSDHECTTVEEAREKLRLGMYVMLREGTGAKNLVDLLPLITPENSRRCFFVTDDRHPQDILEEGHINHMIKTAIRHGLDPVTAVRMATLNGTEYFGLRKLGAIAPGRYADIVAIDNFQDFNIRYVFKNGELVAQDGEATFTLPPRPPAKIRGSVNIKWLEGDEFVIPARGKRVRVIGVVPDQIVTRALEMEAPIRDGEVVSDPDRDVLKICVVERHRATGNIGKGLVFGIGLKKGAIVSSIAHDSHNIVVVGVNDEDIFKAVTTINKLGGGLAVVADGQVLEALQLPVGGLMSQLSMSEVSEALKRLNRAAHELGSPLKDPFMTLSFLALPVIPELKLTDLGLVDVSRFEVVDLFVD